MSASETSTDARRNHDRIPAPAVFGDLKEVPVVRILVVEDEAKTAAYLRKGLEENGFVVDVALRGDGWGASPPFSGRVSGPMCCS